ncbi:MAG: precorrin-2 C(20)-methyltransferase [Deltaproteobacteria bacterium]|nr:precorrin-2 C(20)-methyltransferase [Deltaproteobacteria bacterium]
MTIGTLYGIGIGPGDPDLMTIKGAAILAATGHVFVPKASDKADSLALTIARKHLNPKARIQEIVFPMTTDRAELDSRWIEAAKVVAEVLQTGIDACFLTLGDAFLYSTYIYLVRALRRLIPEVKIVTVPGITAFSAAAAAAEFPVGEAKAPVTIVPTADDLTAVQDAVATGGTVVLMKIGKRLGRVIEVLESAGALDRSVLLAHVGMDDEQIETDLSRLKGAEATAGYMSIILVRGSRAISK